ncbi:hypothetical protein [Sedimenticola hydrogenitrophicus]|uniref:hypothetical protein n=1 Tax=Sedimenticola hydrogenitrophicus TaxID=2967975 RepID=UPI0023B11A06|nr:hypothetical protein [Sedimenticola hydrogenitrophicus]
MPKKIVRTSIGKDELVLENTWTGGIKLFLNGEIVGRDTTIFRLDKVSPAIAKRLLIDGSEKLVEVFCYAIWNVNLKLHIDGEFYTGDKF